MIDVETEGETLIPVYTEKSLWGVSVTHIMLAGTSGLLLTAGFPKIAWHVLPWIAFIPLFYAIQGQSPSVALKLGFVTGIVHYTTLLYWIPGVVFTYGQLPIVVSWAVFFLLVLYLSLYPMTFAAILCHWRKAAISSIWLAPFAWTGLEYIRAFFLTGFPWENLGCSQYKWLRLIQISDIFGQYGLSALVVAANAGFFELCDAVGRKKAPPWKPMLVVALAMTGFLVYGTFRMEEIDKTAMTAPKRTVTLVQGNIDQAKKWIPAFRNETLIRYSRLTASTYEDKPDLTVWPETALPFYLLHDETPTAQFLSLVQKSHGHFIVGSPSFSADEKRVRYFNSAFLIGPDGHVIDQYNKVHLVPYGEYVPFKKYLPFLGKIVEAVGDFESGEPGHVLSMEQNKLGVLICFEVIFPELARAMARNGAQLLISITNDAWFGTTSAPYQHLSMAVFRAVETRRALARAANTGISAFVDPSGRMFDETPLFEEAVRTQSLPIMNGKTVYVSYGDFFAMGCLLITCVCLGLGLRTRFLEKRFLRKRS
jgi:apolipoprotein N-acyltransferase